MHSWPFSLKENGAVINLPLHSNREIALEPVLQREAKRIRSHGKLKRQVSIMIRALRPPHQLHRHRKKVRPLAPLLALHLLQSTVRDREQLLSASMTVATTEEIKFLFLEFRAAGVTFQQNLKREPWGSKTFVVKDPDDNLLLFAGPAN